MDFIICCRWTSGLNRKITLDPVQNIGHVASAFVLLSTQKAVILLQTIASQKNPAALVLDVQPISTFYMKKLKYPENVQMIFSRPKKFFYERYSQVKMII